MKVKGYKLKLDAFEGPLDLLIYLIKKNDIDIEDIPIVEITEQYMEYIDMMKLLDLDIVGDFLVMAATLMHIKSKMLLPPNPEEVAEDEVDPREELVQKLLEYKSFKDIAGVLQEKEGLRQDLFQRRVDEEYKKQLHADARDVHFEVSLFDLITALSGVLSRVSEEVVHEIIHDEFTVEQKIDVINQRLNEQDRVGFKELFKDVRTKVEVVVTFLAVLELIKLQYISVIQKRPFMDVEIMRSSVEKF